jgi:virulence-associated protein VapD
MITKSLNIMSNFIQNYEIILKHLQSMNISLDSFQQIRKPKLGNLELIAMNLTSEYMGINSELQLFRDIKNTILDGMIERSVYNRRKRALFLQIEQVRKTLAKDFNEFEDVYVIDSMPLEICKNARASRSKICRDVDYALQSKGYCASQKAYYFGYKLHGVCSLSGVIQSIDITPASVHDIQMLKDVKWNYSKCTLLGDMGYLSADIQLNLFETVQIQLHTPMRKNQSNYVEQPYIFKRARKRIETLFSQMCDQFRIRSNYAKTFVGYSTRILSKITAITVMQHLNKFVFNRPINNLKVNLT